MSVRISGTNTGTTLEYIEKVWNSFREQQPIHMTFLEEELAALYNNEEKTATIFNHLLGTGHLYCSPGACWDWPLSVPLSEPRRWASVKLWEPP